MLVDSDKYEILVSNTENDEIKIDEETYDYFGAKEYPSPFNPIKSRLRSTEVYYISHQYVQIPCFRRIYGVTRRMAAPLAIVIYVDIETAKLFEILTFAVSNNVPVLTTVPIGSRRFNDIIFRCTESTVARTTAEVLKDNIFMSKQCEHAISKMQYDYSTDGIIDWFVRNASDISFT